MTGVTAEQASEIKRRHRDTLLKIKGVHGVGVQQDETGGNCLVVLTDETADISGVPSEIEGLPVAIERAGPFRAFGS
jgi:hypothetical protein